MLRRGRWEPSGWKGSFADVLSLFTGPGADPAEHEAAGHADPAVPDAPGGGRPAGGPDLGPRHAECAERDGVFIPAQRAGRHRDPVHRGHDHGPAGAEKRGKERLLGGPVRRARAPGHGHCFRLAGRKGGLAAGKYPAGGCVPGHGADSHLRQHYRGDTEGTGQAGHQGGRYHPGRRPHR